MCRYRDKLFLCVVDVSTISVLDHACCMRAEEYSQPHVGSNRRFIEGSGGPGHCRAYGSN